MPEPIQRVSLHAELVEQIRNLITEGKLPVGPRISEPALCERFSVSRTPLREALKVLAHEGLLTLMPNRGAVVRQLRAAEVRDIFPVLGALEGLAGRRAAENASEGDITHIRNLHDQMVAYFKDSDLPAYFQLNQQIHDQIIAAAGSETLAETHRGLTLRVRRVRYLANTSHERWEKAIEEHTEMLIALQARDGERLGDVLQRHLEAKAQSIVSFLENEEKKLA